MVHLCIFYKRILLPIFFENNRYNYPGSSEYVESNEWNNVAYGDYVVIIRDSNLCSGQVSFSVSGPAGII